MTRRDLILATSASVVANCASSGMAQSAYRTFAPSWTCPAVDWITERHPLLAKWDRKSESPYPFSLESGSLQQVINGTTRLVAQGERDWITGDSRFSTVEIGKTIKSKVESNIDLKRLDDFGVSWILAEACCQWVKQNVRYEHAKLSQDEWLRINTDVPFILRTRPLRSQCWGMSILVRDIARAAGLKCDLVSVNYRGFGANAPDYESRNHSVVCFTLDNKWEVPTDVTTGITNYGAASRGKIGTQYIMPRTYWALAMFLLMVNAKVPLPPGQKMSGDVQNIHLAGPYEYTEWANLDTAPMSALMRAWDAWELRGHR